MERNTPVLHRQLLEHGEDDVHDLRESQREITNNGQHVLNDRRRIPGETAQMLTSRPAFAISTAAARTSRQMTPRSLETHQRSGDLRELGLELVDFSGLRSGRRGGRRGGHNKLIDGAVPLSARRQEVLTHNDHARRGFA